MGEEPLRLARDERRDIVAWLAGEGLSTRAIAPIVGVSREQVRIDAAGDKKLSPDPGPELAASDKPADAPARRTTTIQHGTAWIGPAEEVPVDTETVLDLDTGEVAGERKITGLDGKEYTVSPRKTPNRRALASPGEGLSPA